ncbi:MAG: serine protease [Gammaproteobacteria bacterium]|nr:serine protease [Gammaproteobacteria bacterium]
MYYRKGLAIVLCLIINLAQANTATTPRIIGGTTASQGDWPWMVALVYAGDAPVVGQFCGGSVIRPQWVMTAAHCVDGLSATDFSAYAGAYDLVSSPGTGAAIESIHIHPGYSPFTADFDIAVIKLSSPLTAITPIPTISPNQMATVMAGDMLTTIGFGNTSTTSPPNFPDTLQQADVPLVSNATCNLSYSGYVTDNMLCAGYAAGGIDSCNGDSGGPLMLNLAGSWHQIGIVSWGSTVGCAAAGYYGVYTKVAMFDDWLNSIISGLSATAAIDFSYAVTGANAEQTISVMNNDVIAHIINSIAFTSVSNEFSIVAENCTQAPLAAGAICQIDVAFQPSAPLYSAANLEITTDSSLYPVLTSQLTGMGVNASDFDVHVGSPGFTWGSGGNASWSIQSLNSTQGYTSLVSPPLSDDQFSVLVAHLDVATDNSVFFDWRVSSELHYDYLELWLDGQLIERISGDSNWVQYALPLTAGSHVIHWRYIKDFIFSSGQDRGWVDNITLLYPANSSSDDGPFSSAISPYSLLLLFIMPFIRRLTPQ